MRAAVGTHREVSMDRRELLTVVAGVASTMGEFPDGCPASTIFLALGARGQGDVDAVATLVGLGVLAYDAPRGAHWVVDGPKGPEIRAALAASGIGAS